MSNKIEYNWEDNINKIIEVYSGTYQIILDFASKNFIDFILSESHKYIWVHKYIVPQFVNWKKYQLPISENLDKIVLAKEIEYDFIIETSEYKDLKKELRNGLTLLQINILPPYFMDLNRLEGKTRYELLKKECDYLFEIDLPNAIDYGTLRSPNLEFLTNLLENKDINWNDLP